MDPREPALFDQVTSRHLERAFAKATAGPISTAPRPPWRRSRASAGGPSIARRAGIVGTRLALLGLAVTTLGGLLLTTVRAVSDADGVSLVDGARLAILAIVAATIAGQARWLLPRRSRPAGPAPERPPPVILDQIDDRVLIERAPADLGTVGLPSVLLHHGQRRLDTFLWLIVAVATLVLIGVLVVGLARGFVSDIQTTPLDLGVVLRAGLLVLLAGGWLLVARTLLSALLERRRRRRRSALLRLLRYLLQLLRDLFLGARPWLAAPSLAGVAVMMLAAAVVAGVAFDPGLASRPGPGEGQPGPGASAMPSVGPAEPTGDARASTSPGTTAGSTPDPGSPAPSSTTGPLASATATTLPGPTPDPGSPAPSSTTGPLASSTASAVPGPTLGPTPGATATPIATLPPKPTPPPTATPSPTIDPALDSDGDKVPDVVEILYGSKPYDSGSTPEHLQYDATYSKNSCHDKVDNDLDGEWDTDGTPPDKGCL